MTTPILMYHSIGEIGPRGFQRWVVRLARLRAQMRDLAEAGYVTLTVRALVAARAARRKSHSASTREAVLTVDDGYAGFMSHAAPVLRDYGMTTTLFVCHSPAGPAFNELRVLDWGAIAEAHAVGFEIAGHFISHRALDRLSPARALADVLACKTPARRPTGYQLSLPLRVLLRDDPARGHRGRLHGGVRDRLRVQPPQ